MDFLAHPKGKARLWGSLLGDYECVISNFLRNRGWTFSHFAEDAKRAKITLAYHCAVGKGKKRDEQYDAVVEIILAAAKDFWLSDDVREYVKPTDEPVDEDAPAPQNIKEERVGDVKVEPVVKKEMAKKERQLFPDSSLSEDDNDDGQDDDQKPSTSAAAKKESVDAELSDLKPDTDADAFKNAAVDATLNTPWKKPVMKLSSAEMTIVKRQLGGFYLTYLMFFKQPYASFHRIRIDPEDYQAMERLERKIALGLTEKLKEQYDFMLFRMKLRHGFEIVAFADKFGLDHGTRCYLNNKNHQFVNFIKKDKNIQDILSQSQSVQVGQKKYQRYFQQKRVVLNESLHSELTKTCSAVVPDNFPDDSEQVCKLVPNLKSTVAVGKVVEAASKVVGMGQKPVFTPANLLGNESVDRIFMKEAVKRMKRFQVKQTKGKAGAKETKNPYVREGGIFGRKKDLEEGEKESRRKKERAQTSGNLWNYIHGTDFSSDRAKSTGQKGGGGSTGQSTAA